MKPSPEWFDRYGFATVFVVAVLLRIVAVILSRGYMASDDQFQTVSVAYRWLQQGLLDAQGHLTWTLEPSSEISRFPLYTLSLYVLMYAYKMIGVTSLDTMMYGIRAAQAALSLLGVWAVYRIILLSTRSAKWATVGGLIMAAHFAMPFLSVRNLIEFTGGTLWAWALYYLYLNRDHYSQRALFIAGIISGLAWAIRFQVLFAFWVVPFVLLFEYRRLKPALVYCLGVLAVMLAAGFVDWWLLGRFMASSINHVAQGLSEGAVYNTSAFIYLAVILGFFIPPASIIFFVPAFRRSFWSRHRILVVSTLAFILIHAFLPSRMERYMLPVIPALVLILVLSWYELMKQGSLRAVWRKLSLGAALFAAVVNLALLIPFTTNYGHKGMVEPLVRASDLKVSPEVLFVTPEQSRFFPLVYGDRVGLRRKYLHKWSDIQAVARDSSFLQRLDYLIVYPEQPENLGRFRDSLTRYFGPLKQEFVVQPSLVDRFLHRMNPSHNHLEAAWVYALDRRLVLPD